MPTGNFWWMSPALAIFEANGDLHTATTTRLPASTSPTTAGTATAAAGLVAGFCRQGAHAASFAWQNERQRQNAPRRRRASINSLAAGVVRRRPKCRIGFNSPKSAISPLRHVGPGGTDLPPSPSAQAGIACAPASGDAARAREELKRVPREGAIPVLYLRGEHALGFEPLPKAASLKTPPYRPSG